MKIISFFLYSILFCSLNVFCMGLENSDKKQEFDSKESIKTESTEIFPLDIIRNILNFIILKDFETEQQLLTTFNALRLINKKLNKIINEYLKNRKPKTNIMHGREKFTYRDFMLEIIDEIMISKTDLKMQNPCLAFLRRLDNPIAMDNLIKSMIYFEGYIWFHYRNEFFIDLERLNCKQSVNLYISEKTMYLMGQKNFDDESIQKKLKKINKFILQNEKDYKCFEIKKRKEIVKNNFIESIFSIDSEEKLEKFKDCLKEYLEEKLDINEGYYYDEGPLAFSYIFNNATAWQMCDALKKRYKKWSKESIKNGDYSCEFKSDLYRKAIKILKNHGAKYKMMN